MVTLPQILAAQARGQIDPLTGQTRLDRNALVAALQEPPRQPIRSFGELAARLGSRLVQGIGVEQQIRQQEEQRQQTANDLASALLTQQESVVAPTGTTQVQTDPSGTQAAAATGLAEREISIAPSEVERSQLAALLQRDPDLARTAQTIATVQGLGDDNPLVGALLGQEPAERFEPILDENGNIIGQRNVATGRVVSDPRAPRQENIPDVVQRASFLFPNDPERQRQFVLQQAQSGGGPDRLPASGLRPFRNTGNQPVTLSDGRTVPPGGVATLDITNPQQRADVLRNNLREEPRREETGAPGAFTEPTTSSQTRAQRAVDEGQVTLGLINDFETLLAPENTGAVGSVREFFQGVGQQTEAFRAALGNQAQQITDEIIANNDPVNANLFTLDPRLSGQRLLENVLAYRLAKTNDPGGRVSDKDLAAAKAALGFDRQLTGIGDLRARLQQFRRLTERQIGVAQRRLGNQAAGVAGGDASTAPSAPDARGQPPAPAQQQTEPQAQGNQVGTVDPSGLTVQEIRRIPTAEELNRFDVNRMTREQLRAAHQRFLQLQGQGNGGQRPQPDSGAFGGGTGF